MAAEKDGKKSGVKFNIVDFIIIILVIALIAGIIVRFNFVKRLTASGGDDVAKLTFTADVTTSSAGEITEGDIYFVVSNDMKLGTLTGFTVSDSFKYEEAEDGTLVKAVDETGKNIRGEIEASGNMSDDGFLLGGTYFIAPGQSLEVVSKHGGFTMEILSLTVDGNRETE